MNFIDTHSHLDGVEFKDDFADVLQRAKSVGASKVFVPAINFETSQNIINLASQHKNFIYAMIGLHPEEVKANFKEELAQITTLLSDESYIAIGEVGLDFYWSREFEEQQIEAFEEQVKWAINKKMPLMIHCRKAQNEMMKILRKYSSSLCGGVFHCFTGNEHEAEELLEFSNFALGIGGVSTFKSSKLGETLANVVPLTRLVLETDSPYMAPVPMRGKRNEPSFVPFVIEKLAQSYNVSPEKIAQQTTENALKIFTKAI